MGRVESNRDASGTRLVSSPLASARRAHVFATARDTDEELCARELGSHDVVNPAGLGADLVALRSGGTHAARYFAEDGLELTQLVLEGGRVASTLGLSQEHTRETDVQVSTIMALPSSATLSRLAQAVVAGGLKVPIQGLMH